MKKALLVVSFGTSYEETRKKTIEAIENKLADAFKGYDFFRAWTSGMIMRKIEKRDGIKINNVDEAMKHLVAEGYEKVIVQPSHILNGDEYEKMLRFLAPYRDNMDVAVGAPLLTTSKDYDDVVDSLAYEMNKLKAFNDNEAWVLMGHGTGHYSDAAYAALDYRFKAKGFDHVYVGTVEGYPELEDIIPYIKKKDYKKINILPLMVVAGDHAINDMAGEEDSWSCSFKEEGYDVECFLLGIGEFAGIQDMYVEHLKETLK